MLVASSMGATAFQRDLSHAPWPIRCALYDAHHGMLNAILMPYVLQANRAVIEDGCTRLARYLDLPQPSFASLLKWVLDLRKTVGIPHSLAEIGIDAGQAELVGRMAVVDGSAGTNPIQFSADQYAAILRNAVSGRL